MKNLLPKLLRASRAITHISKSGFNKEQKYEFVSDSDVSHAVRTACYAEGIVVAMVNAEVVSSVEITSKSGTKGERVTVSVSVDFMDAESGEALSIASLGAGFDYGDKAVPKAITNAVKYALLKGMCLPTGDDPEADGETDRQPSVAAPAAHPTLPKPAPKKKIPPALIPIVEFAKTEGLDFNGLKHWISEALGDKNILGITTLTDLLPEQVTAVVNAIAEASAARE